MSANPAMSTKTHSDPTAAHVKTSAHVNRYEETSSPRLFYGGMALLLTAIVFAGFWPTYFDPLLSGDVPGHPQGMIEISWPIHLHAAVFVGWMALLLAQAGLVARGKARTHMRFGQYGAAFGLLVILVGVFITFVQM